MRAYFFGNMYLSSIQQGIQAQHCTGELSVRYNPTLAADGKYYCEEPQKYAMLMDYKENHKTSILLNGGYSENLNRLTDLFAVEENPYPWAFFHESDEALEGALTCVGIILPEAIYETAAFVRQARSTEARNIVDNFNATGTFEDEVFSDFEIDLINELNQYGMAS